MRATFTCLDETTVPRLFTTMARPHLEYGNLIWHPRFRQDKVEVEKIQRRATKLIPNMKQLPYEDRLKVLGLLPVEVIHSPSVNSFKSRLDKFWLKEHYKFPWPSVFKTMYLQPRLELINRHSLYIPYIRYQGIKIYLSRDVVLFYGVMCTCCDPYHVM